MRAHKKSPQIFFSKISNCQLCDIPIKFSRRFQSTFLENMALLGQILLVSAAVDHSSPLDFPSQKSFPLFFSHRKGVKTPVSKIVLLFSNYLFFCVVTSDKIDFFGQTAATAILLHTEFSLATIYKIYSVIVQI